LIHTMVCRITRPKVKVKVIRGLKCAKMADFKCYAPPIYACNQKTNGEL